MEVLKDYDVYFSTCSSSLIHIKDLTTRNKSVIKRDSVDKQEVTSFSLGRTRNELLLGYRDGTISGYDVITETFSKIDKRSDRIISLCPYNKKIVSGTETGIYVDDLCVVTNEEERPLKRVVINDFDKDVIGYGGVDNDLKLYDLSSEKTCFTAKGDRHDELNLKQPVSVSDIVFLNPASNAQVATVTLQGQVRVYDVRAQRRPIKIFKPPKDCRTLNYKETRAYTKVCRVEDAFTLVVGTNKGCLQSFDFRKDVKPVKASQAYMGAVVDVMHVEDKVLSCGLDRYWKVHSVDKLEETHQEYLKIRSTGMVVRPRWDDEVPGKKRKVE